MPELQVQLKLKIFSRMLDIYFFSLVSQQVLHKLLLQVHFAFLWLKLTLPITLPVVLVLWKVPFVLLQPFNGLGIFQLLTTDLRIQQCNISLVEKLKSHGFQRTWKSWQLQKIGWREKKCGKRRNHTTRLDLLAEGLQNVAYMYVFFCRLGWKLSWCPFPQRLITGTKSMSLLSHLIKICLFQMSGRFWWLSSSSWHNVMV